MALVTGLYKLFGFQIGPEQRAVIMSELHKRGSIGLGVREIHISFISSYVCFSSCTALCRLSSHSLLYSGNIGFAVHIIACYLYHRWML